MDNRQGQVSKDADNNRKMVTTTTKDAVNNKKTVTKTTNAAVTTLIRT